MLRPLDALDRRMTRPHLHSLVRERSGLDSDVLVDLVVCFCLQDAELAGRWVYWLLDSILGGVMTVATVLDTSLA